MRLHFHMLNSERVDPSLFMQERLKGCIFGCNTHHILRLFGTEPAQCGRRTESNCPETFWQQVSARPAQMKNGRAAVPIANCPASLLCCW